MTKESKPVKKADELDLNDFLLGSDLFQADEPETSETDDKGDEEEDPNKEKTPVIEKKDEEEEEEVEEVETKPNPVVETKTPEEEEKPSFKPLMEHFFEKVGLEWKEELLEEDSVDGIADLMRKMIEANSKPEFASEETERFDEYVRKGGDPRKFYDTVYGTPDYQKLTVKLDKEEKDERRIQEVQENRKRAIKDYYKATTKFSDEKIEREIKKLIDLGEDEVEAEDAIKFLAEDQKTKATLLEQEQEAKRIADLEKKKADLLAERKAIAEIKNIAGWEVTDKDKKGFEAYLFEADKRTGLTPYQKFMKENPDWARRAAWLAFKGLDKNKIDQKIETQVTKKIEKNLAKAQEEVLKTGSRVKPKVDDPASGPDFDDFVLR